MALVLCFCIAVAALLTACSPAPKRPNILWITSEDNGPELGAYGDQFADTPHLDALAAKGMIYTNAWSNAPVCAPARTTIITGVYPTSTGSEHMRSMVKMPPFMKMYPQFLREAGYYCTNNPKEDYNLEKPGQIWDESSKKATYRNRAGNQPFFAIFNIKTTHESQIRQRPHTWVHDPAKVHVPAYLPDTPEVRQDWAEYYDKMTEMDAEAGEILAQLEKDGLADSTIVFYYGDHGPGLPRDKRYPYNSGLQVSLIIYIPPAYRNLAPKDWRPGGSTDRIVGFVDLAPTLLSLTGIKLPDWMQGHAFLGPEVSPEQPFGFGFRGRMDERYDMMRVSRDKRYVYIRNYMPHKIYGQYVAYLFKTPTTQVWKRLFDGGKLPPHLARFWETKPAEELYDLRTDPDEIKNVIDSPEHQEAANRLRKALDDHILAIRDVGFLPENEIHSRSAGSTPYEMGHDPAKYPLEKIKAAADLAASLRPEATPELIKLLSADDSAVRYWAALGLIMRGRDAVSRGRKQLLKMLADDPAPAARIAAAEALGRFSSTADSRQALKVLMQYADPVKNGVYLSMQALNAVDYMDARAKSAKAQIAALPDIDPKANRRMKAYVKNLKTKILADLK